MTADRTTIVITMAGRGQRFRDAGYQVPKFEIKVHGDTLFAWSLSSLSSWLDNDPHLIFVTRREDNAADFITGQCELLGVGTFDTVELTETTDGQATTAMAAEPLIADPDAPFLIYNIDTHVRPAALQAARVRGEGWLPCFPGPGPAWSFARAEGDDRVAEVREKERISDDATVGLYWFRSFARYRTLYDSAPPLTGWARGERYVAPLYNLLVASGEDVFIERLPEDAVVALGTPAEVAAFADGPAPEWAPSNSRP